MNLLLNNFLQPGTDLMKVVAGIAIMLFFAATTAAAAGWISASIGSDDRTQTHQLELELAASTLQDR